MDFGALAGIGGIFAQALLDGKLEQRKLLHASQWSALLDFEKMNSARNEQGA